MSMSRGISENAPTIVLLLKQRMELTMQVFSERLKTLRNQRALSQAALAQMLDVSPRVYNRWEKGTAIPRLDTVVRIADILQVSIDELAGRAESKTPVFKIRNPKLHDLYQQIDKLSLEDQQALYVLLDSLIKRSEIGKLLAG
jgi:transcriptional regulator with XRE-family HTH domain